MTTNEPINPAELALTDALLDALAEGDDVTALMLDPNTTRVLGLMALRDDVRDD